MLRALSLLGFGCSYEAANDWAFMLPIGEMATCPAVLTAPLYLYEPSLPRPGPLAVQQREQVGPCRVHHIQRGD
jgi:hypothetical protein